MQWNVNSCDNFKFRFYLFVRNKVASGGQKSNLNWIFVAWCLLSLHVYSLFKRFKVNMNLNLNWKPKSGIFTVIRHWLLILFVSFRISASWINEDWLMNNQIPDWQSKSNKDPIHLFTVSKNFLLIFFDIYRHHVHVVYLLFTVAIYLTIMIDKDQ